jgi:hypothetical protein
MDGLLVRLWLSPQVRRFAGLLSLRDPPDDFTDEKTTIK